MATTEENKNASQNVNTSVAPTPSPIDLKASAPDVNTVQTSSETVNVGGTAPVAPTVPTEPTAQQQFDALNPAGTNINDIKRPTETAKNVPVATSSAPQAPTTPKINENAPTAQKTTVDNAQANFDQYVGREKEVLTHLNEAYASGAKSGDAIRAFASYDTATPEKKKAIDAFILSKRAEERNASAGSQFGTADATFGAMLNNIAIPDSVKTTKVYTDAKLRFDSYNKWASSDIPSIQQGLSNGTLSPFSTTYSDLKKNPAIYEKLKKAETLNSINGKTTDVNNAGVTMTNDTLLKNSSISNAMEDGTLTADELSAMTETAESKKLKESVKVAEDKFTKLKSSYDSIEDEVRNQYKGQEVTTSELNRIIANRQREIRPAYNAALDEYQKEYGRYASVKADATSLFNTNLGLWKDAKASAEKRTETLDNRQWEKDKLALVQSYENPDINSSNPDIARIAAQKIIDAENKWAKENGVPVYTTDTSKAMEYMRLNGGTLAEALNETFLKPRSTSSEYQRAMQAIYDKNSGALTDYQRAQLAIDKNKMAFDAYKFDREQNAPKWVKTGTDSEGNDTYGWVTPGELPSGTGTSTNKPTFGTGLSVGDEGGQCGTFARKETGITQGLDSLVGSTLSEREKNFINADAKPGGLVLFGGGGYDKQYGHIAVVTGVNDDGTINVRESNFHGDGKVTERKNVPTTFVKGFYNDTPLANTTGKGDKFQVYDEASKISSAEQRAKYLKASGYSTSDYNAVAQEIRDTETKFKDISSVYKGKLDLGKLSETDRQIVMENYNRAVYAKDKNGMVKATVSAMTNNKDVKDAVKAYTKTVSALADISKAMEEYKNSGGDMGILEGSAENVRQKLGSTNDTRLAYIKSRLDILTSLYVKDISGAAVTDSEREYIRSTMPQFNNYSILNGAKLKAFTNSAKDSLMSTLNSNYYGTGDFIKNYVEPDFKLLYTNHPDGTTTVQFKKDAGIGDVSKKPEGYSANSVGNVMSNGRQYNF